MSLLRQRRAREHAPGDYEAELASICGSRWRANEMILAEMAQRPEMSRMGAALALVTRLRHQKDGYDKPL